MYAKIKTKAKQVIITKNLLSFPRLPDLETETGQPADALQVLYDVSAGSIIQNF